MRDVQLGDYVPDVRLCPFPHDHEAMRGIVPRWRVQGGGHHNMCEYVPYIIHPESENCGLFRARGPNQPGDAAKLRMIANPRGPSIPSASADPPHFLFPLPQALLSLSSFVVLHVYACEGTRQFSRITA